MRFNFKIEGMKRLEKSFKRLGDVPQKHVTASVKKGMNAVLKQAKADAPKDSGELRRGMIIVGEKSKFKGKKVYRLVFSRHLNDVFQKPVKNAGESGSPNAKNPAYYPIAQEYGFFARNGKYIPGFGFARGALGKKSGEMSKIIISNMQKKIDEEIRREKLK